jgi:hypothetical protein
VVAFFRDPLPAGPFDPRVLLAPADGKVVSIIETDEPAFFQDRALRISIFMNVFDCHVNRYPAAGVVRYRHYNTGHFGHAAARGIIIADTKLEFGTAPDGELLLIDELLTPDSSRFWPADRYAPGRSQPSFDKQPLRDYLAGLRTAGAWNGEAPPPPLPAEVVEATSRRYLEAYRLITGTALGDAA